MNGEIDLLCDVFYTPERAEKILYPSLPMGTEAYYIYVSPDNYNLLSDDIHVFDGKTFAVNSGSVQETCLEDWADANNLTINIQEIFDKTSNETIKMLADGSVDAIVRWNHHELGMIPPGEFITLFENSGQINLLDRFAWAESIRQVKEWHDKYEVYIPISVNLSRIDFYDPDLEKTINELVKNAGVGRENLHLEVTESAYSESEDLITEIISRFREKGYHIEMDDFGTGISNLYELQLASL